MTRLAHPEWLVPVLGATLFCAAALLLAERRARRRGARLGVAPGRGRDALLLGAVALLGLALLGPRLGERSVALPARGVDVVFLLDVSRSMDARDVPPSRLARARRAVEALLERLPASDRAALAAFGERGVLLTPLTPDRQALAELLAAVDTDLVQPAGSNLGAGVEAALEAFATSGDRARVLFVLSDGEDPEARRNLGAAAARRAGVRVVSAGIGSEAGAAVPDRGAPLREPSGREVVTRRRLERLTRLAEATGGETLAGDRWGALDLDAALAALRRDAGDPAGAPAVRRIPSERALPLAAAAFALLLAEVWPRRHRRSPRPWAALGIAAAIGLAASPGSGPGADAELRRLEDRVEAEPQDARSLVRLGLARLDRQDAPAARRAFAAAAAYARDPELAALAYYDLGVAWLESGELAAARDAFLDTLALTPDDARARFNLEWALVGLASAPPAPAEPEPVPPAPPDTAPTPEPLPPPQSDAERERLLESVTDDAARGLAGALALQGRTRSTGPVW